MSVYPWFRSVGLFVAVPCLLLSACAGSREGEQQNGERRRVQLPQAVDARVDLNLEPASGEVRTVQLYLGDRDESQLPILTMGGNQRLTLEFDLMEAGGRALSAYFYHADQNWERDLTPVEYLSSFQRDDLLDFTPSQATNLPYVHYTYRFPNPSIGFTVSGNYVLRVTEQGQENEVLFEQPFFVAEQTVGTGMMVDNVMVSGWGHPATVPTVRFTPPGDMAGNVYDYSVCFVRNGQFERARCSDDPMLMAQPSLQFHLEPEMSFPAEAPEFFLDLSGLYVGGQIEATDISTVPHSVTLKPDYAQFPGTPLAPVLNGQSRISGAVRNVADPDVSAEYVEAGFSFVPPNEQPVTGDLFVTGSFNDWRVDPAHQLTWVPERGRYEGNLLLKQGQYEYRYVSTDRRLRQMLEQAPPRIENQYIAFVYYSDLRLHTDRLVGVEGVMGR